ncbi:MAG: hypothetical protein H0Z34_12620 [Brevibacillus sp.]|nr:hypothetical protein [Brevibacillus sp.]
MAKKNELRPISYPSEFQNWLKGKRVRRSERRDPAALQRYYQEWEQLNAPKRRRSLFRLPAMDLDQIAHHARRVSEIVETLQSVKNVMSQTKTPEG